MSQTKLKPLPELASDEEAERFVDEADLCEDDQSGFAPVKTSRGGSPSRYTLRMPSELFARIDRRAGETNVSIDSYVLGLAEKNLGPA